MPRSRNLYDPSSTTPFKVSRSKIELFLECPRCFYMDRRLGIERPKGPPFTLNTAVDQLLKKEFDVHRARGEPHPLMKSYGIDAIPFSHPELEEWRENFVGVQYLHLESNLLITGAVDDIWVNSKRELIVVEYKSTSTDSAVTLDGPWKKAYKRQLEMYQWLLRRKGFSVSRTGYFVYVNADKDRAAFDRRLEFKVNLLPYEGDDSWVDDAIVEIALCLRKESIPKASKECPWCAYRKDAAKVEESNEAEMRLF